MSWDSVDPTKVGDHDLKSEWTYQSTGFGALGRAVRAGADIGGEEGGGRCSR